MNYSEETTAVLFVAHKRRRAEGPDEEQIGWIHPPPSDKRRRITTDLREQRDSQILRVFDF